MQFMSTSAWRRLACGRVLLTEKGIERHKEHCRYKIPVIEGQVSVYDIKSGEESINESVSDYGEINRGA